MIVSCQIVSVVNYPKLYDRYIGNNPFYKGMDLVPFDNTKENIPIPVRYNDFIDHRMLADAWVIFCHQDFSIREDVALKLKDLPQDCIYGPIGIKACLGRELVFCMGGATRKLKCRRRDFVEHEYFGRILQGHGEDESKARPIGRRVDRPYEVDTVDCCCLIVHSSLIRKYNLRFDGQFTFHLFTSDFSIAARKRHGIKTKILQLEAFHLSEGGFSAEYFRNLGRLLRKYPEDRVVVTGSDFEEVRSFRYIYSAQRSAEMIKSFTGKKDIS